jgi:FkbM family methyltransferase
MAEMVETLINGKWTLLLPRYRHERAEWPHWEFDRLAALHETITGLTAKVWKSVVRAGMDDAILVDPPKPLVYDIGAEEGDFTALWCQWGADVIAVEPNPKVWPNIKLILEGNGYEQNMIAHYVGLVGARPNEWENQGIRGPLEWPECAYGEPIGNHGFVSLVESGESVPVTTIDNIRERSGRKCDVITMDIEGSELRALEGATETLKFDKPVVFVSVHNAFMQHDYGCRREDLLRFMRNLDYRCEWLQRDHEEHWKFTYGGVAR